MTKTTTGHSRRDFLRYAASTAAIAATSRTLFAQPAPSAGDATTGATKKLGWALVGIGTLSRGQLLPGLEYSQFAHLTGAVTGYAEKGDALVQKYTLDPKHIYSYDTFDKIKDDPDIDVIYIVLPTGMHAEYAIRAAKAGKHVFCEKPMAITSNECQQMIDACKTANVKLGVGYRMQFEPHLVEMHRLIKAGAIGKIKSVESAFGYNMHGDPNVWRLNKKLGGGAIYDVGLYCINSTRFALGEEPAEVTCTIDKGEGDPRFKDMEAGMDFVMKFPSGAEAHCKTAYNANSGNLLHIEGESGSLRLEPAFGYSGILLRTNLNGENKNFTPPQIPDQFATEIDSFCDSITNNKPVQTPGEEGLRDIKIIEALYKAGNDGKPVQL